MTTTAPERGDFAHDEQRLSQLPALQLLINLGYEYLTPAAALKARGGRADNVLLEGVLAERLKAINSIQYKGQAYRFSEENIQTAIQALKNVKYDGLQKTNEAVFDLLTLGKSLSQPIDGDTKSYDLGYIDWQNWQNNRFHVTAEFAVDSTRGSGQARPDLVLFVNGIPLSVIECKAPTVELDQGIEQTIRNQSDGYIPGLFIYSQLVLTVNKNAAKYATAGTGKKFWAVWRERDDSAEAVAAAVNAPLAPAVNAQLFSGDFAWARGFFDELAAAGPRQVTPQDTALYSLCRPERLLDLAYNFTVFERGIKKIARYPQYFTIKATLQRVQSFDAEGRRRGGLIWHTQGSGKSLTMVWLARSLLLCRQIPHPRLLLVTDRKDLDKQLGNTFAACGIDKKRASSGRDLLKLLSEGQTDVVTTLIHKFAKALKADRKYRDESRDIFVLVDESHRSNYGSFAARMRQMFPKACYLGFTGTPLLKSERSSFDKFDGLIRPHYSIQDAVVDAAVVPLLYEGRHVAMTQDQAAVDLWFERHTQGLTAQQKADLKRKYARAEMLNRADRVVYMRTFDISEHFRETFQGTPYKAQLVAPRKETALKYHQYLNEIGHVSSAVVISAPDKREGYEEPDDEPSDEVVKFWDKMMRRYGSEDEYNKQVVIQFLYGDVPEILIVVDKLLTGFDAPRNTALYLCRSLREHTLLQAIARVNRLYEDEHGNPKEFGYIVDYASLLGELNQAMTAYKEAGLDGFELADLEGTLHSIREIVDTLPQRHANLWDLFRGVANKNDEEACELALRDQALRDQFYECLADYAHALALALASEAFLTQTSDAKLKQYKDDMRRFQRLRQAVKRRYQETIDYCDYEPKIRKLLDTHIQANEVLRLNEPVNIFDERRFGDFMEEQEAYGLSDGAKADAIAHATLRTIRERWDQDPAYYETFSKLIQQVIDDFNAKRISESEYLRQSRAARDRLANGKRDDLPASLARNPDAAALFGVLQPLFAAAPLAAEPLADVANAIVDIVRGHHKVNFWQDDDAQKNAVGAIEDYLFDTLPARHGVKLPLASVDVVLAQSMRLLKNRQSR